MHIFLVLCPQCKHQMKYQGAGTILTAKRKRCVYCGHSFLVHEHIVRQIER